MKSYHQNIPSEVSFIGTDHMLRNQFGVEGIMHFIEENAIEIQSMQSLANGRERRYSARQIGAIWGEMLENLLMEGNIRLGQMIHNYKATGVTHQSQTGIINKLTDIISEKFPLKVDENQEAFLLGLGLIFGDDLDWSRSDSVVHTFQRRVDILVAGDTRRESLEG